MDEDLRNRYRRDFTNEVIRPARHHNPPPRPAESVPKPAAARAPEAARHREKPREEQPAPVPAPRPAERVRRQHRAKLNFKKLAKAAVLIAVITGLAGGGFWFLAQRNAVPIPASVRASLSFPLLYPAKLPAGYVLDKNSFNVSGNVLLYSAANGGNKIAFTVQQRPSTFDFDTFYKQGMVNSTVFTTSVGQAAIGTTNGRLLGSLVADQTWLLVSSTSKNVHSADLRLVLNNAKLAAPPKH